MTNSHLWVPKKHSTPARRVQHGWLAKVQGHCPENLSGPSRCCEVPPMRRAVAIAAIIGWVLAFFLLLPDIKNFLLTHPLWYSSLAACAWDCGSRSRLVRVARLRRSKHAPRGCKSSLFRTECLQNQIGELTAELAAERSKHLQQIAENTKKPAEVASFAKG